MIATRSVPSARRVPPSMIVIGVLLFGGFLSIVAVTVTSLTNGAGPAAPELADLPLPHGVEVIATHATCRSEACDGHGMVVDWDPLVPEAAIGMLVDHLGGVDWMPTECAPGARCMARGDLRAELRPWVSVDPSVGTVMRSAIRERNLDEAGFIYVRLFRCGIIEACE